MEKEIDRMGESAALRFRDGDERALAWFYQQLYAPLLLFAGRWVREGVLAEEIVTAAFVNTWRHHARLDSYAGIRAYLYKAVLRESRRVAKKEEKQRNMPPVVEMDSEEPFRQLVRAEVGRLLREALLRLPPGSRTVIALHYFEGKSTGEIARELSLAPSTVKTQKSRGLAALRQILPGEML